MRIQIPSAASVLLVGGIALATVAWARTPQGLPNPPTPPQTTVIPMLGGGATADSNGRMIAVTGVDVSGASVLYLVDTERLHLAVYQANSAGSNQGVRFIGARRIDLDLELDGFNDKSEFTYKQLKSEFEKLQGKPSGAPTQPGGSTKADQ